MVNPHRSPKSVAQNVPKSDSSDLQHKENNDNDMESVQRLKGCWVDVIYNINLKV